MSFVAAAIHDACKVFKLRPVGVTRCQSQFDKRLHEGEDILHLFADDYEVVIPIALRSWLSRLIHRRPLVPTGRVFFVECGARYGAIGFAMRTIWPR